MKQHTIGIIGLGYVGLPLAVHFARHFTTIGYDINQNRVTTLNQGFDYTNEVSNQDLQASTVQITSDKKFLPECNVYIITVPTPTDEANVPDLTPIKKASELIASVLKKGDIVVYESTVYPGVTEEECVPILEKFSNLKHLDDFNVAYSPERINPGDKVNTLESVMKIVSGDTQATLETVAGIYSKIIKAGVYKATTIKVAEAAKVIENTQRDVNIALMNELSELFNTLGIDTHDVLNAAGSKYNFLKFFPGFVGGHCISVDPYYLTHKAEIHGYTPNLMLTSRQINNSMVRFVGEQTIQRMLQANVLNAQTKVLILGVTFKENVPDIRNSKVFDLIKFLKTYHLNLDCIDIHANTEEVQHEYGITLATDIKQHDYDCVILAVSHNEYVDGGWEFIQKYLKKQSKNVVIDVKAVLPVEKPDSISLWRP